MTDWESKYINKIVQGDCLELMKELPDKCVDLVLTDPPYGIKINQKGNNYGDCTEFSRKKSDLTWDNKIPTQEYFNEIFRVSKNQIVFGVNYFWDYFHATKCYIVWDKRGNLPAVPFCDTEFAWASFDKMSRKYTVINHGFIKDSKDHKTIHPTQKPSELFMEILSDFSNGNDLILDPFIGSGTTAVAAIKTNRRFIGMELSPEYCEIAQKRVDGAMAQTDLFFDKPT